MSRNAAPILLALSSDPRTAEDIAQRAGLTVAETVVALGVNWWEAQAVIIPGVPGVHYRLRDLPKVSGPQLWNWSGGRER